MKRARWLSLAVGVWAWVWLSVFSATAQEGPEGLFLDLQADSVRIDLPPELRAPVAAMEVGDYVAAAEELNEIVLRDSSHVQALRLLASAYFHMEAYVQATHSCWQIAALDTLDAGVVVALGYLHQKQGDIDTAEVYYRQALNRDPNAVQAYQGLGWIYLRRRQLEQAMEMVARTSERAPGYGLNYLLMGRVLTAQGFYQNAAAAYRRAFALRPALREHYGILLQELVLRHGLTGK